MSLHPKIEEVTERIRQRSAASRGRYLVRLDASIAGAPYRGQISCTNLAHAFAASEPDDKLRIVSMKAPNLGIVTAYNDMLSAHQPFATFPDLIKKAAREVGATAQVAGGVPAMCDGVTQGQPGMELSLFSRDVIALATAVSLSHNMFDAALCLGICDKIVPGLVIGALRFGHLPVIMVPGGPMPSGISQAEKAKVRQKYAAGEVGQDALLESEAKAYHAPGTCTFYGTANSNQMMMELMGLHIPCSAFIHPYTPLRDALTRAATQRAAQIAATGKEFTPIGRVVNEQTVVNAIVGLLATGGSTNHTMHLVAMARAAGIIIDWSDFEALSHAVPLIAKVYPNGDADVNQFHDAGGIAFLVRELLDAGLLHEDILTVAGHGLRRYTQTPILDAEGKLVWVDAPAVAGDDRILSTVAKPFASDGGLRLLQGNVGRAVIKISAVKPEHRFVHAPARIFENQDQVMAAYRAGELNRDFVAVVRFQGPRANGMPELHKLTPALANIQDKGFHVALVTDGRMSGASGKVPAAIHVTPEAADGGVLARIQDGDMMVVDADNGLLHLDVPITVLAGREPAAFDTTQPQYGLGRDLFTNFRQNVSGAEEGACTLALLD